MNRKTYKIPCRESHLGRSLEDCSTRAAKLNHRLFKKPRCSERLAPIRISRDAFRNSYGLYLLMRVITIPTWKLCDFLPCSKCFFNRKISWRQSINYEFFLRCFPSLKKSRHCEKNPLATYTQISGKQSLLSKESWVFDRFRILWNINNQLVGWFDYATIAKTYFGMWKCSTEVNVNVRKKSTAGWFLERSQQNESLQLLEDMQSESQQTQISRNVWNVLKQETNPETWLSTNTNCLRRKIFFSCVERPATTVYSSPRWCKLLTGVSSAFPLSYGVSIMLTASVWDYNLRGFSKHRFSYSAFHFCLACNLQAEDGQITWNRFTS